MIIFMYIITGFCGTLFWETPIWTFLHVEHIYPFTLLPNVPLNVAFMCFAGVGLAVNTLHAYMNVHASRKDPATIRAHTKDTNPLTLLLPFLTPIVIQVAWLSHPTFNHSAIIDSALLIPFLCAWGLQFAHQVGRMIIAHVTLGSEQFPIWDWVWVWSVIGAVDANLPRLMTRPPIIQTNTFNTTVFVYLSLIASLISYGRFVYLVINDITEYLGVACLTVRKKDEHGNWVHPEKSS
ncbi:hypothetical protein AN958_01568 [Leucoagaricus sp. SymC.cos]|nr:hypothetical protein AN958_01568 [Leucoagaricus sp. SymC.cos]